MTCDGSSSMSSVGSVVGSEVGPALTSALGSADVGRLAWVGVVLVLVAAAVGFLPVGSGTAVLSWHGWKATAPGPAGELLVRLAEVVTPRSSQTSRSRRRSVRAAGKSA